MAGPGRLAAVPEESADGSASSSPPCGSYRDQIRTVIVSGTLMRSAIFSHSQSSQSGSSYSSASNSCPSSKSGCSSGSISPLEYLGAQELKDIARQMVRDGYTQRMVQAFDAASSASIPGYGGGPDDVLETWFLELDLSWVLQIRREDGLKSLRLQDRVVWSLQDLVQKWIRGLTVIVHGMIELASTCHEMAAIARLGRASISKMLGFVDYIIPFPTAEKLKAVLNMYAYVSYASYSLRSELLDFICIEICTSLALPWGHLIPNGGSMLAPVLAPTEAQSIFTDIDESLSRQVNTLNEAIFSTMEEVRMLVEDDGLWDTQIKHADGGSGAEVHKNTSLVANSILSMKKTIALVERCEPSHNMVNLRGLINDTIDYLKDLLLRKSESCSDPSLRYLFLLNNSYFVAQVLCEPLEVCSRHHHTLRLTHECKKYMDSYLDVSWGHVLSCIPKSRFPGPIHCWINTSSLAKFESTFHKTYQTQKFWKVPDPELREALRRAIIERVISGYRDHLKEHPELEQLVGVKWSSPEALELMLRELFEG